MFKSNDGGWSWVVSGACFLDHVLFVGMISTMGIYYTYIMEEFDVGLTQVTIIGGVYTGLSFAGAVLSVPLAERLGSRRVIMVGGLLHFIGFFSSSCVTSFPVLFLTMAIIPGIGNSLSYPILLTSVDRYFDKKKYIAMAVGIAGASVGMVSLPILSEFLLSKYGFHGSILVHSALSLHILLCGAVVFPLHERHYEGATTKESGGRERCKETVDMAFYKTPRYICYLLTNLIFSAAIYIPGGQLPTTAISVGVDITDISLAVSMGGISSGCGRLCFGILCYYFKYHIIKMWIIFLFGLGISMLIVPFLTSFPHFLAFTILYGFLEGNNNVGWNLSQKNLIKPQQYGRSLSIVMLVCSVGIAVGNPLTAFLKDSFSSPETPYYIGAAICVASAVIMCPFSRTKIEDITDTIHDVQMKPSEPSFNGNNTTEIPQESVCDQQQDLPRNNETPDCENKSSKKHVSKISVISVHSNV